MPYFQMWREAWQDVDRAFKRMEHLSKMLNIASTQMIPKVHDRLAVVERKIKKFDPMLEQWENGGLVKQTVIEKVVEKIVEVPVAGDAKTPQRKKQKPHKVVDYEIYQQVQQLTAEGLGISRIGKVLGISKQTVSNIRKMPPERVERLRQLHESGVTEVPCRLPAPLTGETLRQILDIQKNTPGIPLSRLSVLTGVSEYRLKKYFALSDAERVALLEAADIDVSVGMSVDTTPRRRGRKPRGTYIPSDALPNVHGEDDDG